MKKIKITLLLVALLISSASYAQFTNSRSNNSSSFGKKGNLDMPNMHLGIRAGVSSNSVGSPYDALTDLHLAVMGDFRIVQSSPLYIETGLQLINRGYSAGDDAINALALDVPILGSYHFGMGNNMSLQPFAGPYVGYNFEYDIEYGLRLGCGFGWKKLYANMGYDFGLNKLENYRDDFNTGTFFISVGWNFISK